MSGKIDTVRLALFVDSRGTAAWRVTFCYGTLHEIRRIRRPKSSRLKELRVPSIARC